jgi:glycerate kinase
MAKTCQTLKCERAINMAGGAAGAAGASGAAAAAIANAIKASGVIVSVDPYNFELLLQQVEDPLVVHAEGGIFSTNYQYLVGYKGLAFYTKAQSPIPLPVGTQVIRSQKIWLPG